MKLVVKHDDGHCNHTITFYGRKFALYSSLCRLSQAVKVIRSQIRQTPKNVNKPRKYHREMRASFAEPRVRRINYHFICCLFYLSFDSSLSPLPDGALNFDSRKAQHKRGEKHNSADAESETIGESFWHAFKRSCCYCQHD